MSSESREVMHDQHTHPTAKTYIGIGVILAVLTAIEFALYYFEVWGWVARGIAMPSLVFLSTIKFILVVMFYMHLKFDSRVYTGVFLFPLALGTLVIISLIILYRLLPHIPV